jgi:hypothetical protein
VGRSRVVIAIFFGADTTGGSASTLNARCRPAPTGGQVLPTTPSNILLLPDALAGYCSNPLDRGARTSTTTPQAGDWATANGRGGPLRPAHLVPGSADVSGPEPQAPGFWADQMTLPSSRGVRLEQRALAVMADRASSTRRSSRTAP